MKFHLNQKINKIFKALTNFLQGILTFFKEVIAQAKKIDWPSFNESLKYTVIVIAISAVIAIFLGGLDFGFSVFINKVILR